MSIYPSLTMIKRVLIPTDGYGLEDHVIRYVARAFPFAEFHTISVVNTYERGVQLTDILYMEMKESAKKAIERSEKILREEGIESVNSQILEGLPSRTIVNYAKKNDIDIIAMRVYCRKSTASAHRMGSTVTNVLRRSNMPILTLVNEAERFNIRNILLLTDGTGKSKNAENYAILLTSSLKARMHVMYLKSDKEINAEKKLENVLWKASFWEIPTKKIVVNEKDTQAIMGEFKENDIAVMGIGRKMLFWIKIGHLAQFIATHSPIPVIFVRAFKKRWSLRMPRK